MKTCGVRGRCQVVCAAGVLAVTGQASGQSVWQGPGGTSANPTNGGWLPGMNWQNNNLPLSGAGTTVKFERTQGNGIVRSWLEQGPGFRLTQMLLGNDRPAVDNLIRLEQGGAQLNDSLGLVERAEPPLSVKIVKSGRGVVDVVIPIKVVDEAIVTTSTASTGSGLNFRKDIELADDISIESADGAPVDPGWHSSVWFGSQPGEMVVSGAGAMYIQGEHIFHNKQRLGLRVGLAGRHTFEGGVTISSGTVEVRESSMVNAQNQIVHGPFGKGDLSVVRGSIFMRGVTKSQQDPNPRNTLKIHNPLDIREFLEAGPSKNLGTMIFEGETKLTGRTVRLRTLSAWGNVEFTKRVVEDANGAVDVTVQASTNLGAQDAVAGRFYFRQGAQITGTFSVASGDVSFTGTMGSPAAGMKDVIVDPQLAAADRASFSGNGTVYLQAGHKFRGRGNTKVRPGKSPGILTIDGPVDLEEGSALEIEIDGPTAGTGEGYHDQLIVTGEIMLDRPALEVKLLSPAVEGREYLVLRNDGTGAINGLFTDPSTGATLTEGAMFNAPIGPVGWPFAISYQGGDGNDVVITAGAEPQAQFIPLGFLPGATFSQAWAVSDDGRVVGGTSLIAAGFHAFVWTHGEGMVTFGEPNCVVRGLASGGEVAVGEIQVPPNPSDGFVWDAFSGLVSLADLPGGNEQSAAMGVNGDSLIIVGWGTAAAGREAIRWIDGEVESLGELPGGSHSSMARGVSASGDVIVGESNGANGLEAFVWSEDGGLQGIGDLAGGSFSSAAYAASGDGSIIVGSGTSAVGVEAMRWTEASMMTGLGHFTGDTFSRALGISDDGETIVGFSGSPNAQAFIWTEKMGLQHVRDVLIAKGATGLDGWTLTHVTAASADGSTITGYGRNPHGFTEAWVAYLGLAKAACYADCDISTGTGILDIFDFLCFGNRFAANDPYACDCDTSTGPGVCDIFDFLCFGNAFEAGCP